MKEKHSEKRESKGILYEALEEFAREKIRQHLQDLVGAGSDGVVGAGEERAQG